MGNVNRALESHCFSNDDYFQDFSVERLGKKISLNLMKIDDEFITSPSNLHSELQIFSQPS